MLKKNSLFAMFAFAVCVMAQAQGAEKERMLVSYFMESDGVSEENSDKIRDAVFSAINASARFVLIDVYAESTFNRESSERAQMDNDIKAITESHSMKANDLILEGNVTAFEVKEEIKDGKKIYTCAFSYSVEVNEYASKSTVATKSFTYSGTSLGGFLGDLTNYDSPEKAINGALSTIEKEIKDFIIEEFPLWGTVIAEDYEVKKDKLVKCYIDLGSNVGIQKGQMFVVYEIQKKAGKEIKKEIGRLKAEEVDEEITNCKVSKGDKELKAALDRYLENKEADENAKPLTVKSDIKRSLLGL